MNQMLHYLLQKSRTSRYLLLFISTLFLFIQCNNKQQKKEKALEKEVKAIHDSVMPKMSDIRSNKSSLEEIQKKLRADTQQSQALHSIDHQIHRLDSAHEAMMQWMRQYQPPADSLSHRQAMNYLKAEKDAIKAVEDFMLKEIQHSDSLIKVLKK